ncbi:MAG TPA: sigma-70 family RNA polymerase sigma factor [Thermoanaerobaculia bacterium]|nr:sigma-70 family RNA polymerase sigma factor [Thermoanaerobaculia bacterium]
MAGDARWVGVACGEDEKSEVVLRARAGDTEAFGELVEELWAPLVGLARAVLAGDPEAEDVVQEALVVAWRRLPALRDPARFPAWVRRIVARRCLGQLRRRRLRPIPLELPAGDDRRAQRPAATNFAAATEAAIDVSRLLAALPPRQRAVLYLTAVEGCTDREIAAMLGILPPTVRVHRLRAARRLRSWLEGEK